MQTDTAKKLPHCLAAWSDAHLKDARAFVALHADLIPRDLTNAQLYGLANIARSVKHASQINVFLQQQAMKAERAGKSKMKDCWEALRMKFESYQTEAVDMARRTNAMSQVDNIHCQLVQRFIQHLIAESLVQAKTKMDMSSHQSKKHR